MRCLALAVSFSAWTAYGEPGQPPTPATNVGDTGAATTASSDSGTPTSSGDQPTDNQQSGTKKTRKKEHAPFEWDTHPTFRIGDVKMELGGRLDADWQSATPEIGLDQSTFSWQNERVEINGTAGKRVAFGISHEFVETGTPWKDVFADVRVVQALSIQAGRFKVPFGYETLRGETTLDFVRRSMVSNELTPGRDVGTMAHGSLLGGKLGYEAGYFGHDGNNASSPATLGGTHTFASRLVIRPFAVGAPEALTSLQAGVAVASSRVDDQPGLRAETVLQSDTFFSRIFVNGRRLRTGLEASWADGPASLSAEYIVNTDQRRGMAFDGTDLPDVRAGGWYIAGTWLLWGDRKHGHVSPWHAVPNGGFGAVELAARAERLYFGGVSYPGSPFGFPNLEKLAPNADRANTIGVNWYLSRHVKLQGDYISETVEDPQRSPAPSNGGHFSSTVLRVEFAL
jgi:phosphate-selective porin